MNLDKNGNLSMNGTMDRNGPGETGLEFFGKISASISHEIKNVLAIINENAGLLGDLAVMAEKGGPLEPERLKTLAERVARQIRRADGIIKNMNRFSHTVDEWGKTIDLCESTAFSVALSNRFAAMAQVSLELAEQGEPVMITTSPFYLLNLIGLCLDFAMGACDEKAAVKLSVEKADRGGRIRFEGLQAPSKDRADVFPLRP